MFVYIESPNKMPTDHSMCASIVYNHNAVCFSVLHMRSRIQSTSCSSRIFSIKKRIANLVSSPVTRQAPFISLASLGRN